MRVMKLMVRFKDSPHPWTFEQVSNMTTEGGLLRITQEFGKNKWFPLENVFQVEELERKEVVNELQKRR